MKRKALLRNHDRFEVLDESEFTAEAALQEALKRNPEVLPVADLDLNEVVVVGREVTLSVGAIDLLLVDSTGRVVVVETKLSSNPELRRQVVAQLLDYGASLWRATPTLKQFEALVLRYWGSAACEDARVKSAKTLQEGLEPIFRELCGEDWDYAAFEGALGQNLANGQHILLVVASGLMDGLSRDLLQYLNMCLQVPVYGVEIDVFQTEARQLIVPRGVRYTARPRPPSRTGRTDREKFLAACTPAAAAFFGQVLDEAESKGMDIYWGQVGFSVRIPVKPIRTAIYGFPPDQFTVTCTRWPLSVKEQAEFLQRLRQIGGLRGTTPNSSMVHIDEKTQAKALAGLAVVWQTADKMLAAQGA